MRRCENSKSSRCVSLAVATMVPMGVSMSATNARTGSGIPNNTTSGYYRAPSFREHDMPVSRRSFVATVGATLGAGATGLLSAPLVSWRGHEELLAQQGTQDSGVEAR